MKIIRKDIYVTVAVLCLGAILWTYYNTDRYQDLSKGTSLVTLDKNTGMYHFKTKDGYYKIDIPNATK